MRGRERTVWVLVRGRTAESARGAEVEIVEARRRGRAEQGDTGGGWWWAEFADVPAGTYTVRVRYPSGVTDSRGVRVGVGQNQVRFDEHADARVS